MPGNISTQNYTIVRTLFLIGLFYSGFFIRTGYMKFLWLFLDKPIRTS